MVLEVILVVLGLVLVVLGVVLVVLGGSRLSFLIKRFLIKCHRVYPILCAVKATILGHILAPFGGGLGGF